MKRIDELYRLIEEVTGHNPRAGITGSGGGGGGKGSKSGSANTAPDSLFSTATVRIVDMLGEGEIAGVVGGLKGIYLNDIPVQNADGTFNFKGFSADFRTGTPDQSYMAGYPDVQTAQNIGVKVNQPTPVSASITEPAADRARVTIQLPALFLAKNDGSMSNNSVVYRIETRYNGGPWVNPIGDQTITGKTTSGYFRSHEISLPKNPNGTSAPWTVRVTRLSPDTDSFNNSQNKYTNQSDTIFYSLTTILDAKFSYPSTALVGITAQASSFGSSVPTRKYLVNGNALVPIPSNYNPATRAYSGLWDGTFTTGFTNNPAWILFMLLDNDRFGLGEYIDTSAIDKWSLYDIGRYCDQMVSDGKGGQEPRAVFNGVIETQQEAFELLQIVAQVFRGLCYWSSGSVTAAQDRPRDPVLLATEANVIDGEFTYSSSSYKARHTVAVVRFQDPNNLYKVDYEVVEDEAGIARYGYNPTRVDLLGCTSRGQANRAGRWILLTELKQTQALSYRAGLDHATARPGDVVAVLDPSVVTLDATGDLGGRLEAGSTASQLVLDRPITITGSSYAVSVALPDGTVAKAPIANGAGTYSTLSLGSALATAPDAGAVFVVEGPTKPRLFSIISAHEAEPHIYAISLLQYEPSKFAAVDDGAKFEPTIFSQLGSKVEPPTNLTVRESQYMELGQPRQAITLSWQPGNPFNVTGYYVTAIRPSGTVVNFPRSVSVSVDILDVEPGDWLFLVTTIGLNGNASQPAQLAYTVKGWQGQDPTTVTGLQVLGGGSTFRGRSCTMTWTNNIPASVTPYPVVNVVRVLDISSNALLHYEVLPPGVTQWTYGYDTNVNEGGPRRSFRVQVSARYASGTDGPPTSLGVSNPAPATVGVTLSGVSEVLFIDIDPSTDSDWNGYLIWVSTTQGFNPLTTPVTYDTLSNFKNVPGTIGTTYYVRVAAYDLFGKNPAELNISAEKSYKLSNTLFDPTAPTIPGTPALTTAAETAADGTVSAVIKATWAASTGSNFGGLYSVGIAYPGGDYVLTQVAANKWEMHNLPVNTTFQVRVRAEAANGFTASGYSPVASITTAKSTVVPANPTNPVAIGTYQGVTLTWTPPTAKDIAYVEVWSLDGSSAATSPPNGAKSVRVGYPSSFYIDPSVPVTGVRTYWLRSVSTSDVTASGYTTPVTATNPQIAGGALASGIIDATKFASSLAAVSVVTSLPTTKTTQFVTLTSDGKLYRWDAGSNAYVRDQGTVNASDIVGQITSDQIAGLAATKLTTQIQRTNIADGAIDTPQLNAGAVTTAKIFAGAITASKLSIANVNLMPCGDFSQDILGVVNAYNTTGTTQNTPVIRTDWAPAGMRAATASLVGGPSPAAGTVFGLGFQGWNVDKTPRRIPVSPGTTYEASAYLSLHRCTGLIYLEFFDTNGSLISAPQSPMLPENLAKGLPLATFPRTGVIGVAPSNAVSAIIEVRGFASGGADPYVFASGIMFGPVPAGTTELSPYVDPGFTSITGSNIITGSITTTQLNVNTIFADSAVLSKITTGVLTAGAIKTSMLDAGAVTAEKIGVGLNSGNLIWGSDGQVPSGFVNYYSDTATTGGYAGPNGSGPTWQPPGMGSIQVSCAGSPSNTRMIGEMRRPTATGSTPDIACIGGARYEVSAYISSHRCIGCINILFYDAANKYITETNTNSSNYDGQQNGPIANWWRVAAFIVAPSNAATIQIRVVGQLTGGATPYVFATGLYLALAQPNQTAFSAYTPQSFTAISGGQIATESVSAAKIIAGTITGDRIAAGTIVGGNIAADTITAGNLKTGTLTADIISVGNGSLSTLFGGSNTTKIQGGAIAANTITANLLKVGSRPIQLVDVNFYSERDSNGALTNVIRWTGGYVLTTNNAGQQQSFQISPGGLGIDGGYWYIWWCQRDGVNTYFNMARDSWNAIYADPDNVLLATVSQITGLSVLVGGTIIDGTRITTRSIQADQIAANQIQTIHMKAGTISGDRIAAGSLAADRITTGTLTVNAEISIGGTQTQLWSDGNGGGLRVRNRELSAWRLTAGYLGPWTGDPNDFGLIVWDAGGNARVRFSNALNYIDGVVISDATITNAKIADLAVTNGKIKNLEVDTIKIANGSISSVAAASASGDAASVGITVRTESGRILITASMKNDPNQSRGNRNPGSMYIYYDRNADQANRVLLDETPKNFWLNPGVAYYWGSTSSSYVMQCPAGYHSFHVTTNAAGNLGCYISVTELSK